MDKVRCYDTVEGRKDGKSKWVRIETQMVKVDLVNADLFEIHNRGY